MSFSYLRGIIYGEWGEAIFKGKIKVVSKALARIRSDAKLSIWFNGSRLLWFDAVSELGGYKIGDKLSLFLVSLQVQTLSEQHYDDKLLTISLSLLSRLALLLICLCIFLQ